MKWEEKKTNSQKKDKDRERKEKLINSGDSERKSLLHFLSSLSEERKVQTQSYSSGDLILEANNKFNTLPGYATLLGTQRRQFYLFYGLPWSNIVKP